MQQRLTLAENFLWAWSEVNNSAPITTASRSACAWYLPASSRGTVPLSPAIATDAVAITASEAQSFLVIAPPRVYRRYCAYVLSQSSTEPCPIGAGAVGGCA